MCTLPWFVRLLPLALVGCVAQAIAAPMCAALAGTFSINGMTLLPTNAEAVTFFQAASRPTRVHAALVRVGAPDPDSPTLPIDFLANDKTSVGMRTGIPGACENGSWVARRALDQAGDGNWISGQRVSRYSRGEDGALLVAVDEDVNVYYVPGVPVNHKSTAVSRFPAR